MAEQWILKQDSLSWSFQRHAKANERQDLLVQTTHLPRDCLSKFVWPDKRGKDSSVVVGRWRACGVTEHPVRPDVENTEWSAVWPRGKSAFPDAKHGDTSRFRGFREQNPIHWVHSIGEIPILGILLGTFLNTLLFTWATSWLKLGAVSRIRWRW